MTTSSTHSSSSRSSSSDLSSQPVLAAPRFEDAELAHITSLIADMIDRLIAHNDQIPLSPDALTRFHSRSPPGISVYDYLQRIVKYANVERSCLLITLHYIDQICTRLPKFTITSLTVHRFLISSVTVSSKALCDVFCTNSHYAKVGGIKLAELNMLEREFLSIIDWRLASTRELLQAYYVNLIRTHSTGGFRLAPEPQPCTTPVIPASEVIANSAAMEAEDEPRVAVDDAEDNVTSHFESGCENSITAAGEEEDSDDGDDVMYDESNISSSEDEHPGIPHVSPHLAMTSHHTPSPHVQSPLLTPRTAAKRTHCSILSEHDGLDQDASSFRSRGRRRLEEQTASPQII